jgi:hypothetical protein
MKKNLSVLLLFLLAYGLSPAQKIKNNELPTVVAQALKQKAPGIDLNTAELVKEGPYYKAEYLKSGKPVSHLFSEDGAWIETESGNDFKNCPSAVQQTVTGAFKGYELLESYLVEKADGNKLYHVLLSNQSSRLGLYLDSEGKVVKRKIY